MDVRLTQQAEVVATAQITLYMHVARNERPDQWDAGVSDSMNGCGVGATSGRGGCSVAGTGIMDADEIEANKRRAHYTFTANYAFTFNGTEHNGCGRD
jgi:hypothetical protein